MNRAFSCSVEPGNRTWREEDASIALISNFHLCGNAQNMLDEARYPIAYLYTAASPWSVLRERRGAELGERMQYLIK